MAQNVPQELSRVIETLYRSESGRILATLVRLLGDLDLAEEAMHEAFAAALDTWPKAGVPDNPRPWLISTARFKAIDTLRRRARFDASQDELARYLEAQWASAEKSHEADYVEDDRLRLIFTCCHPSLAPEAQVALTLREVCGLTTEEIARAFLVSPATLAQRIVRAKTKIREAKIPYEVPGPEELPQRLGAVLQVVYLVFNEGYSAAAGAEVTRAELTGEAIRLGRLLNELQPEPEVMGLLALMLLQESRRAARTSPTGDLILLENQDRSLWNREQIAEGVAFLQRALQSHRFGSYTLQAALAAVHAQAESVAATDWRQIVSLYDQLLQIQPSPVVRLNRAVAIAMCEGPEAGLAQIDVLLEQGELANYYLAHSVRADMYRRLGRTAEARASYEKALALTQQEPERQFLQERIRQIKKTSKKSLKVLSNSRPVVRLCREGRETGLFEDRFNPKGDFTMRVMVLVKATPESEKGTLPDPQLLLDMGKFNEELIKAGILLAADGLQPSSKGARVKFSGTSRTVIDGPFTEAKELVAGFWIWQVKSLEEAIEWVKRCPKCHEGEYELEIRQIFEMEDFAPVLSEEQIQHKVAKRAELPNQAIKNSRSHIDELK